MSFFANNNTTGGTGSLFGAPKPADNASSTNTTTPATSAFGSGSTFGSTAAPAASSAFGSGGLFGSSTTTTNQPAGTSPSPFGASASSTTPATGTSGGLFGGMPAASAAGGLFGRPQTSATNPSTTTGGLFGATSGTTGNNATTPATGSIFGGASLPATGGLFGAKPTGTTTPTSASNFFSKPPEPPKQGEQAAKPAVPSFFGNTTATTSAAHSASPTPSAFGFGAKPADKEKAKEADKPATSTAAPSLAPTGGLFGGFKPPTPATGTGTGTVTPSGGLFGTKPEEKKEGTSATTATTAPLFGAAPKPAGEEKKDAPAAAPSLFSLGGAGAAKEADKSKDSTATATAAPTGTSTVIAPVPPPSMLRGKTIEEIVNRWSTDLETHIKEFNKYAAEVAVWDRALIENSNNLAALYSHVLAAEQEQNEIDQSLDHIEQQQKDLASTLGVYEQSVQDILGGQGGNLRALDTGPADTERDKNYVLASELHSHLDDLTLSLTQMIDSVNSLSLPPSTTEDPMTQIAQILSSHLESLQWIDGAVQEIEAKVTEVEKRIKDSGETASLYSSGRPLRGFGTR